MAQAASLPRGEAFWPHVGRGTLGDGALMRPLNSLSEQMRDMLRGMTQGERVRFMVRYATLFAETRERYRDVRRRKSKKPAPTPDRKTP